MNVYDQAHNLSRAIKDSQEFKEYFEIKKEVDSSPELKKIIEDYHSKQIELQQKQLMGEELNQEALESIQKLSEILAKDPKSLDFMQKELRFSVMMNDVYQILSDVMKEESVEENA